MLNVQCFYYFCVMKVLIDDKIPYIREAAEWLFGEVAYLPGNAFQDSPEAKEADALIIRTRTRCNEALLGNSNVQFVATATIGYDHIDTAFMQRARIAWTNCPGCNASSVAQYVRNALLELGVTGKVGIVGYGHVGKAVRQALEPLGYEVLINDPPLARTLMVNCQLSIVNLDALAEQCDIITFHTPLTTDGEFPTFHLANEEFFSKLRKTPVIINTARGGVVDEQAMLHAYDKRLVREMIIDTWEGEPHINPELLQKAAIATPHIAGYSADGKSNATRMALRAVCHHFAIDICDEDKFMMLTAPPTLELSNSRTLGLSQSEAALSLYNPLHDSTLLKATPADFEALRNNYPLRRESF